MFNSYGISLFFFFVCFDFISFICPKLINMAKRLNLILLVLISSIPLVSVYAFFDKDIRLLTMQDGLADNTVSCICKDADGFMWFGTNNGLSRYDGKMIKNFSPMEMSVTVERIV